MKKSLSGNTLTVNRRTIARGALWAVPAMVMASAAPALASSTCVMHVAPVITDGVGRNASGNRVGKFYDPESGVTITAKVIANTSTLDSLNMLGRRDGSLVLQQSAKQGEYQTVQFTASQKLYNMTFKVFDVDSGDRQKYIDSVTVNGPVSAAAEDPGYLTVEPASSGVATFTAPDPKSTSAEPLDDTDPRGHVLIASDKGEGITSFSITYRNIANTGWFGSGDQTILIAPVKFSVAPC
ncbi:hypothetical protein ACUH94_01845 [Dermabacteraceae bacterium P7074]